MIVPLSFSQNFTTRLEPYRQAMKALLCAASVLLPVFPAAARPVEPDYPCYLQTLSGQVIDLTRLCLSPIPVSPTITPAAPLLIFSDEEPRQEKQQ